MTRRTIKTVVVLVGLVLSQSCAPTTSKPAPSWDKIRQTNGAETSIGRVSLDDGTVCYTWYGQFSCVRDGDR